jgi:hypothetical protein
MDIDIPLHDTVKKIVISALLLTTVSDMIKGFSLDILVPIINALLPGDITIPTSVLGTNLYFTRFFIRLINLFLAVLAVQFLKTKNLE